MSSSDTRVLDFAQARVNRIADAIDGLAERLRLTNHHVERLNREVGGLRGDMRMRFDRMDHEPRDTRGEVILQANQIINAQQQAMRAMMRLDDMEQLPEEPKPWSAVADGAVRAQPKLAPIWRAGVQTDTDAEGSIGSAGREVHQDRGSGPTAMGGVEGG
jgi:hypothetical protein